MLVCLRKDEQAVQLKYVLMTSQVQPRALLTRPAVDAPSKHTEHARGMAWKQKHNKNLAI